MLKQKVKQLEPARRESLRAQDAATRAAAIDQALLGGDGANANGTPGAPRQVETPHSTLHLLGGGGLSLLLYGVPHTR